MSVVEFGNTGSRIAEEFSERIFNMHFSSEKSGGIGLGLTVARKIVSEHHRRIFCRSE